MVADLTDRIHTLDYGRTLAAGAPEAVDFGPREGASTEGESR
jgi:ABC-type branched-subunit amino acid transport system ATPase component